MRVDYLITGSNGFIGSKLTNKIITDNKSVIGVDIASKSMNNEIIYHQYSDDEDFFCSILKKYRPRNIIQCAGAANVNFSISNPLADFEMNVINLYKLLESISKYSSDSRILFPSSAAVYGEKNVLPINESDELKPISPYGFHKKICEDICLYYINQKKLNIKICRIFSAYGPGLRKQLFWDMFNKIKENNKLELFGTGNETRDYIYIEDLVDILLKILSSESNNIIFNVSSGVETKINDVAEMFVKSLNSEVEICFTNIENTGNPTRWVSNNKKMMEVVGNDYFFTKVENGIKYIVEWLKNE